MSVVVETPSLVGSKLEGELLAVSMDTPPLDESLLQVTSEQLDLLRSTLHMDDAQLRKHILEVQKE